MPNPGMSFKQMIEQIEKKSASKTQAAEQISKQRGAHLAKNQERQINPVEQIKDVNVQEKIKKFGGKIPSKKQVAPALTSTTLSTPQKTTTPIEEFDELLAELTAFSTQIEQKKQLEENIKEFDELFETLTAPAKSKVQQESEEQTPGDDNGQQEQEWEDVLKGEGKFSEQEEAFLKKQQELINELLGEQKEIDEIDKEDKELEVKEELHRVEEDKPLSDEELDALLEESHHYLDIEKKQEKLEEICQNHENVIAIDPLEMTDEQAQRLNVFLKKENKDVYKGYHPYSFQLTEKGASQQYTLVLTHKLIRYARKGKENDYSYGVIDKSKKLGKGGSGIVFRAVKLVPTENGLSIKDKQVYKIQQCETGYETEAEFKKRIEKEDELNQAIPHLHAKKTVFVQKKDGSLRAITLLRYLSGEGLDEILRKDHEGMKVLTTTQRLMLMTSLFEALAEIHKQGIVHRDLKPENIIVEWNADGKPVVKIFDFGAAKKANEKLEEIGGTLIYASPEVVLMKDATFASDLYSMALVVCELFRMDAEKREFSDERGASFSCDCMSAKDSPTYRSALKANPNLRVSFPDIFKGIDLNETDKNFILEILKQSTDRDATKRLSLECIIGTCKDINAKQSTEQLGEPNDFDELIEAMKENVIIEEKKDQFETNDSNKTSEKIKVEHVLEKTQEEIEEGLNLNFFIQKKILGEGNDEFDEILKGLDEDDYYNDQTNRETFKSESFDDLDLLADEVCSAEIYSEEVKKIEAEINKGMQSPQHPELEELPPLHEKLEQFQQASNIQKPEVKKPSPEKIQRIKAFLKEQAQQKNDPVVQAELENKFLEELRKEMEKRSIPEKKLSSPIKNVQPSPQEFGEQFKKIKENLEKNLPLLVEKKRHALLTEKEEKVEEVKTAAAVLIHEEKNKNPLSDLPVNKALLAELHTQFKKRAKSAVLEAVDELVSSANELPQRKTDVKQRPTLELNKDVTLGEKLKQELEEFNKLSENLKTDAQIQSELEDLQQEMQKLEELKALQQEREKDDEDCLRMLAHEENLQEWSQEVYEELFSLEAEWLQIDLEFLKENDFEWKQSKHQLWRKNLADKLIDLLDNPFFKEKIERYDSIGTMNLDSVEGREKLSELLETLKTESNKIKPSNNLLELIQTHQEHVKYFEETQAPTPEEKRLDELQNRINEIRKASETLVELAYKFEEAYSEKKISYIPGFEDSINELINDGLEKKLDLPQKRIGEGRELFKHQQEQLAVYKRLLRERPNDLGLLRRAQKFEEISLKALQDIPDTLDKLHNKIHQKIQFINNALKSIEEDKTKVLVDDNGHDVQLSKLRKALCEKMVILEFKITDLSDDCTYEEYGDVSKKDFNDLLDECHKNLKPSDQEDPSSVKKEIAELLETVGKALTMLQCIKEQEDKEETQKNEDIENARKKADEQIEKSRIKKYQAGEEEELSMKKFNRDLLESTKNRRADPFDGNNLLGRTEQLNEKAERAYKNLKEIAEKIKEALDKGIKFDFEKKDVEELLIENQTEFNQLKKSLEQYGLTYKTSIFKDKEAQYKIGMNHERLSQLTQEMNRKANHLRLEAFLPTTGREEGPRNLILIRLKEEKFMKDLIKWNSLQNVIKQKYNEVVIKNNYKSTEVRHAVQVMYDVICKVGIRNSRFDIMAGCLIKQIKNLDKFEKDLPADLDVQLYLNLVMEVKEPKKEIMHWLESEKCLGLKFDELDEDRKNKLIEIFDDFEKNSAKETQQEKWKLRADFVLEELREYEQASCKIKNAHKESTEIRKLIKELNVKVEKDEIPAEQAYNILMGGLIEKREVILKDRPTLKNWIKNFSPHFFKAVEPPAFDKMVDKVLEHELFNKAKAQETFDKSGMFEGKGVNFSTLQEEYLTFVAAPAA
jgi:serine/threonine protein kinase